MQYSNMIVFIFLFDSLIASAVSNNVETDYCNKTLCHKGDSHVMCLHPDDTPASACNQLYSKPITDSEKEDLLHLHNTYRERFASGKETRTKGGPMPPAADIGVMTWDEEAATIAQRNTLQCTYGHDRCRNTEAMTYGQNIASVGHGGGGSPPLGNLTDMASLWYEDEVAFLSNDNINKFQLHHDSGHLTQLVWATSYKLGCGYTRYMDDSGWWQIYLVCNYGPAGNWGNLNMYTPGEPCSKCPEGSTCGGDPRYPSLCNSDTGNVPVGVTMGMWSVYEGGQGVQTAMHWSVFLLTAAAARYVQ